MWPHVRSWLLVSKHLAFSGMTTRQVIFLRCAVPLDFSLSQGCGQEKAAV